MALPPEWTHEPHNVLAFRPGMRVADIDCNSSPGFKGTKDDAPAIQAERNAAFASLQEMLYANGKKDDTNASLLLVLQGMDTAGKGGIVEHVVGAVGPRGAVIARAPEPRSRRERQVVRERRMSERSHPGVERPAAGEPVEVRGRRVPDDLAVAVVLHHDHHDGRRRGSAGGRGVAHRRDGFTRRDVRGGSHRARHHDGEHRRRRAHAPRRHLTPYSGTWERTMILGSVISSIAKRRPSRPNPESFDPP